MLPPVGGIIDELGFDVEFSAQSFDEGFGSSYLAVGRTDGFTVGNDADSNGLAVAVPRSAWDDRPLSLPFFGWLYLAVAAAKPVA